MKDRHWNKEDSKIVGFGIAIALWACLIIFSTNASALSNNYYSFPHQDRITMDVEKTNGGGGTWVCPSVQACYIYTLEQEARGATQYCESLTIKRNGKVIWWRKYQ